MGNLILALRKSALARDTFWMFMGQGMRVLVQGVYFVIIARMLGPSEYGSFGAVIALAAIVSPFTSLGFGAIVVKKTVEDRNHFKGAWGNALLVTLTSGVLILGVMVVIARFSLPSSTPIYLLVYVGIADVIANRVIEAAALCFQAVERMKYTAIIFVAPSITRTAYAIYQHAATPRADARQWAFDYMVATIIPAALSVWLVGSRIGWPKLTARDIWPHMTEGIFFSISMSSQTIYNDIDKTMLARLSTLDGAGIYMTAYRIVDMSFMPVGSLAKATYAQFFRLGQKGVRSSFSYAKRQFPRTIAYGAGVGAFLFLVAPVIPKILGGEYGRSVEALRLLALIPLLRGIHYFLALTLTGSDHQKIRAFVQVGIALLNIGANLWLIPIYSWRGAAWISIACDGSLVIGLYIAILICQHKEASRERKSDAALHKLTS